MARSGERKRSLIRSLDYNCVYRFRLRRLLAFLSLHRYDDAFEALSNETAVLFRAEHLQHLVQLGMWQEAIDYVYHFIPAVRLPDSGKFLVKFIGFISDVSRYKPYGVYDPYDYEYNPHSSLEIFLHGGVDPGGVKVANIIASVRPEKVWRSINWQLVWLKAADIVGDLVAQVPQLNEMRRMPLCPARSANVLPIGLSSSGRRGLKKKSLGRMPADALARSFLSKKRLPSSSQGTSHSGLPLMPVTMTRLAGLIEECLQAGNYLVPKDEQPVESSCTEGTKTITGSVHQDLVPGINPKRPLATEDQEFVTTNRQKIGKLGQDSGLSSQECCLQVPADAVGSIMKRWMEAGLNPARPRKSGIC
ncbi:hypothetical protein ACP70R_010306 [Stipagrostis hirtigluma subsp. patula]